jgi:hypothetical protein
MVYGQHDETGLARQPGSSGKEIQPVLGAELARGAVLQLRRCPVRALYAPCSRPARRPVRPLTSPLTSPLASTLNLPIQPHSMRCAWAFHTQCCSPRIMGHTASD